MIILFFERGTSNLTRSQYQREREAEFRNLSEKVNSKAMWYMFIQVGFLVATVSRATPPNPSF